jgi:hypothetical protein
VNCSPYIRDWIFKERNPDERDYWHQDVNSANAAISCERSGARCRVDHDGSNRPCCGNCNRATLRHGRRSRRTWNLAPVQKTELFP